MDLDWLRDFQVLVASENFSRAAEARNVSQPAFSRRIRSLEDWIGAVLFVRGAQGTSLTPAGETFRPLADDIMRSLHRARRDTRAVIERETASLSIVATHALSFTFFPGWMRRHMDIEAIGTVNLISDSMEGCERIMLDGEVHFLLCHHHAATTTRFEPGGFLSVALGVDRLVPVSAPDADKCPIWPLPSRKGRPSKLLAYSKASGLGRILAARGMDDLNVRLETIFTSHLAATLGTMARQGHGIAWLPMTLVDDDIKHGRLVRAGATRFDVPIEIRLFRSRGCRNQAADKLWARVLEEPLILRE